jgi:ArsR family transcriptional regulator
MDTTTTSRSLSVRPSDPAEPCCEGSVALPTLDAEQTATLADRLKALADPTRLRMLDLLAQQGAPLCVCEITDQFPLHQPTISHHLRILREARLIVGERRGTWAYYAATDAGKRSVSLVRTLL